MEEDLFRPNVTIQEFTNAQVLIAADVLYDVDSIDSLVKVVKLFLSGTSTVKTRLNASQECPLEVVIVEKKKLVILAVTRRNVTTFGFFLNAIQKHGIGYTYLATRCDVLSPIFGCNFSQGRDDVQIVQLTNIAYFFCSFCCADRQ
jgi:hypothetical protein